MANIPQNTSYDKTSSVKKPVSWDVGKMLQLRQKITRTNTSSSPSFKYVPNTARYKTETTTPSTLQEGERFSDGNLSQDATYKNKLVSDYNTGATGESGTPTGALEEYVTEGSSGFTPTTKIANANSQVGMSGEYLVDPENPGQLIKNVYTFDSLLKQQVLKGLPSSMYQLDHDVPRWAGGANTLGNIEVLDKVTHQKKTDIQAVPYTMMHYSHLATLDPASMNPSQQQEWGNLSEEQKSYFKTNPVTTQKARLLAMDWKNLSTAGVPHLNDEDYGLDNVSDAMNVYNAWTKNATTVPKTSFMDWLKEIPKAGKTVLKETGQMLGTIPVLSGFARGATQGMVEGGSMGYASNVAEGLSEENALKSENWKDMSVGGKGYLLELINEKKKTIKNFNSQEFLNTLTPEKLEIIERNASPFGDLTNWGGETAHAVGQLVGNVVGTALAFSKIEKLIFGGGIKAIGKTAISPLSKLMGQFTKTAKTAEQATQTLKNTQAIVQEIIEAGKGVGPITMKNLKTFEQLQGVAKDGKVLVNTNALDKIVRNEATKKIAKSIGLQVAFGQLSAQPDGEMGTRVERAIVDSVFGGILGNQAHNFAGYAKVFHSTLILSSMENGWRVLSGKEDPEDLIKNSFTTAAIMTGLHSLGHGNAKNELTGKMKKQAEADRIAKLSQDVSEDSLKQYHVIADPTAPSSFKDSPMLTRDEFIELNSKERIQYINWAKRQVTEMAENSVRINSDGTKMEAVWDDADLSKALQDLDLHFRNLEKGALGAKARGKADIEDIKSYLQRMKKTTTMDGVDTAPSETVESVVNTNKDKLNTPTNRSKATDAQRLMIGENAPVDGTFAVTGLSSKISARSNANTKRVISAMSVDGSERVLDRAFVVHRPEMEPYIRQKESSYSQDLVDTNRVGFEKNPSDYLEVYVPLQNKETGNIEYVKVGNVATEHRLNSRMGFDETGNLKDVAINHSNASIYPDFSPVSVSNDQIASWMKEKGLKGSWVKLEKAFTGEASKEPFLSFSMSADDAVQSMSDFANTGSMPNRTGIYRDVVQMAHVQNPKQAQVVADQVQKTRDVEPTSELLNIVHNKETSEMDDSEFSSLSRTEPVKKTIESNVESLFANLNSKVIGKKSTPEDVQSVYSNFIADIFERSPHASYINSSDIRSTQFLSESEVSAIMSRDKQMTAREVFNGISKIESTHPAVIEVKNILNSDYFPKYYSNKGAMSVVTQMPVEGTKTVTVDTAEMKRFEPQVDEEGRPIVSTETEKTIEPVAQSKIPIEKIEPIVTENPSKVALAKKESEAKLIKEKTPSIERKVYSEKPIENTGTTVEIASERSKQSLPKSELKNITPQEQISSADYSNFSGGRNQGVIKVISQKQEIFPQSSTEWKNLEVAKKEFSKEQMLDDLKIITSAHTDENGYINFEKTFENYRSNLSDRLQRLGVHDPFSNPKSAESRDLFHWLQMNSKTVKIKSLSLKASHDGKNIKYSTVVTEDPNSRSYSRMDEDIERYNKKYGTDIDILYFDSGNSGEAILRMGAEDGGKFISDYFKKNGYVVVGAKGNTVDDIFAVKFDKKLVDKVNADPETYINAGEKLTDEGKFIRAFTVDVMGLPPDAIGGADAGGLMKRWKEYNSHEIVNALRNEDGSVPKWTMTVLDADYVIHKLGLESTKGFLYNGQFFMPKELAENVLKVNGMGRMSWIKPTFVTNDNGTLRIQKGQIKSMGGEDVVMIRRLLGRDLAPNEILSFNDNVKIGKTEKAQWSYELSATDMRLEWHNPHRQQGGFSFANNSKFRITDQGVEKHVSNYEKRLKTFSEFNSEMLQAKTSDDIVAMFDKYEQYGLKETNLWDVTRGMMKNGAGIDDIRNVIAKQTKNILNEYVLGGRWVQGDHMRLVAETKSRYIDPVNGKISKEDRFLVSGAKDGSTESEIAMSRKTWEKNGKPSHVIAYRTPTTRQISMIKAKVVLIDNANLKDELVMMSHDDVVILLEGDLDGDSIRFAVLNNDNIPPDLMKTIQSNRAKNSDINLRELTPYDKEFITEESLLRGAMNSITGGQEVGNIASTARVLNDVMDANLSFNVKQEGKRYTLEVFGKNGMVETIPLESKKDQELFTGILKPKWGEGDANQTEFAQMIQEALDSQKYKDMSERLEEARQNGLFSTSEILISKVFGTSDPVVIRSISNYLKNFQTPYHIESGKFESREDLADALDSYRTFINKFETLGGKKGVAGTIVDKIDTDTMMGGQNENVALRLDKTGAKAVKDKAFQDGTRKTYEQLMHTNKNLQELRQTVQSARKDIALTNWKRGFTRKIGVEVDLPTSTQLKDSIVQKYKEVRPMLTKEEDDAFRYYLITADESNIARVLMDTQGVGGKDTNELKSKMVEFANSFIKSENVKSEEAIKDITNQLKIWTNERDGYILPNRTKGRVWRIADIFSDSTNDLARTYYQGRQSLDVESGSGSTQIKSNITWSAKNELKKSMDILQSLSEKKVQTKKNFTKYKKDTMEKLERLKEKIQVDKTVDAKTKTLDEIRSIRRKIEKNTD